MGQERGERRTLALRLLGYGRRWYVLCLAICSLNVYGQLDSLPETSKAHKRAYLSIISSVWGINYPSWLASQIDAETGWREGLTSSANAQGICQFIPDTAESMEVLIQGLDGLPRYSNYWCYYAQLILMRQLNQAYKINRDECNSIMFASAGYNGAPKTLNSEIQMCIEDKGCDPLKWREHVATKRARAERYWRENRNYVRRIDRREELYAQDGWGRVICEAP